MSKKDKVSADIVYQELHQEMRRFRDYELNSSSWYTAILVAILGFVITIKYGDSDFQSLKNVLNTDIRVQVLFSLVISILGLASVCSVRYASLRYLELKSFIFDEERKTKISGLGWHKFKPIKRIINPVDLIYIIHFLILVLANAIIFSASGWCAILTSLLILILLFVVIFVMIFPKDSVVHK